MKPVSFVRTSPTALGEAPSTEGYRNPLSLDTLLVSHPTATFFVRVGNDVDEAGEGLGVAAGDLLIVDRSVVPTLGKLVLAVVDGELVLRRFTEHESRRFLVSGTPKPHSVELTEEENVTLWGVVTATVRSI